MLHLSMKQSSLYLLQCLNVLLEFSVFESHQKWPKISQLCKHLILFFFLSGIGRGGFIKKNKKIRKSLSLLSFECKEANKNKTKHFFTSFGQRCLESFLSVNSSQKSWYGQMTAEVEVTFINCCHSFNLVSFVKVGADEKRTLNYGEGSLNSAGL